MHRVFPSVLLALLLLAIDAMDAFPQTAPEPGAYSRLNSFGLFGEYSNDSSHILIGNAENRKLLDFGGTYSRRVLLNRFVDGQYMVELRPILLESDPVFHETINVISPPPQQTFTENLMYAPACKPFSASSSSVFQGVLYSDTETVACNRRWTFGEGFSPFGFKWNFRPRHRIQPVFTTLAGYMFSTQPIPISSAGSFNFTFEFGAGFEFYRSGTRSIRAEYRFHHLSNAHSAASNPGVDSGLLQVTYAFGR
jgi:hypothetical protein